MKQPKFTSTNYAEAFYNMEKQHKETMFFLAAYKDALFLACYELSNLLDNTNPKTEESYWLSLAIKNIESKKPQTPTA